MIVVVDSPLHFWSGLVLEIATARLEFMITKNQRKLFLLFP